MPNNKKVTVTYQTGASLEVTVVDIATGYRLDDADGLFRAAAADARVPLPEHLVANSFAEDIPGLYELSESRSAWPDGEKIVIYYLSGSNNALTSAKIATRSDVEVPLPADLPDSPNPVGSVNLLSAGGLTGAHKVTLQLYVTGTTTPIADVFVDVYDDTNTARLNGASLTTSANGQVEFYRNDGTYKIRMMKAGVSFVAGTVVVNGADVSATLYGTPFAAPVPSDPGLQVLYGWVWQLDKSLVSGVNISAQIAKQQAISDAIIENIKLEDTSDASGYFELQVLKGSKVQVLVGDSYAKTFTVTNDDSKTLASY